MEIKILLFYQELGKKLNLTLAFKIGAFYIKPCTVPPSPSIPLDPFP